MSSTAASASARGTNLRHVRSSSYPRRCRPQPSFMRAGTDARFSSATRIDADPMEQLIAPEELAALSMEEARARLVSQADWSCRFGPFAEDDFSADKDDVPWSLLVQNVDQFHPRLQIYCACSGLRRWLMDEHVSVFPTRAAASAMSTAITSSLCRAGRPPDSWPRTGADEIYINGLDLKILRDPVDGDTFEVGPGDASTCRRASRMKASRLNALTFSNPGFSAAAVRPAGGFRSSPQ